MIALGKSVLTVNTLLPWVVGNCVILTMRNNTTGRKIFGKLEDLLNMHGIFLYLENN